MAVNIDKYVDMYHKTDIVTESHTHQWLTRMDFNNYKRLKESECIKSIIVTLKTKHEVALLKLVHALFLELLLLTLYIHFLLVFCNY
jgi:hypothetical protein